MISGSGLRFLRSTSMSATVVLPGGWGLRRRLLAPRGRCNPRAPRRSAPESLVRPRRMRQAALIWKRWSRRRAPAAEVLVRLDFERTFTALDRRARAHAVHW